MPTKISRLAIAALALTALAISAAPALAGGEPAQKVKIVSTITMPPNSPAFHGRVKAARSKDVCIEQRTVKLFKERPNGDKKLLGTDVTDSEGKWQVIVDPLKPGDYFAVVTKETHGNYVCERDKSLVAHIVAQ